MTLAGDTDVDVGIEMAFGTLVACDSVNQALICRWGVGLSFACGRARGCGEQDSLQHRGRLLSTKRNSDGPRLCTRNEAAVSFSFVRRSTP